MSKFCLILCAALMLQVSRAYHDEDEYYPSFQQKSIDYFTNPYEFTANPWSYVYHPTGRVPDYPYERHVTNGQETNSFQLMKHLANSEADELEVESRLLGKFGANLLNAGFFSNKFGNNYGNGKPLANFKPFSQLNKWVPLTVNPDFPSLVSKFETCTTFSEEEGICVPGAACSLFGGRPSGSCGLKSVCCINTVTRCGTTITLNNTYWQPPLTLSSSCSLIIKLDAELLEQPKEISQVRIDFASFSIGQPNTEGNCATDVFKVTGSENAVPIICGDNAGQHIYLNLPSRAAVRSGKAKSTSSLNEVTLTFEFDALSTAPRMWNIKISMLPKGASYLAPPDCLQYFTSTRGKINSFNWQDVESTSTRQLNNQNYNICFRTEEIDRKRASEMCLSICPVKNGGDAFSLTTPSSATNPAAAAANAQAAADIAALTAAEETLTSAQEAFTAAQTDLTAAEEAVAAATPDNLADLETNLATAEAALTQAQTDFSNAQAVVDAAGAAATDAELTAVTDAETAITDAQAAVDAAQAAVNPPELIAAQENLAVAQTALPDAEAAATAAQENVDLAQAAVTDSTNAALNIITSVSLFPAVGTIFTANPVPPADVGVTTATCLYDYLLISGGRDATNIEADRYCGNELNPAGFAGLAASVPVCTPIKSFRITYRTDGTEGEVVEDTNVIQAPADEANAGFCLIYQEK